MLHIDPLVPETLLGNIAIKFALDNQRRSPMHLVHANCAHSRPQAYAPKLTHELVGTCKIPCYNEHEQAKFVAMLL